MKCSDCGIQVNRFSWPWLQSLCTDCYRKYLTTFKKEALQ